ncbi:MAG: RNA 2',3'-cyclic phosphodiesterase [Desulfobacteraceae bacterium]|jgi:2'-5' RNA ligase|nr:RNA 2',3'-cyclic phosphodiesterase [Desulfobacteraceae bacterium]
MSGTIRTFIALELPPAVISLLDKVQQDLKRLKIRARWVQPENIHLTLKFLGDTNPADINKIGAAMTNAAIDFPPLALTARGIGVFPGIRRPRVIWVGLGGDIRSLLALQSRLADELAGAKFSKDKKPFKAHLTLGRIKQSASPAVIRQMISDHASLNSDEFICDQIFLFKSDLQPSGAVHSRLKQTNLGRTNLE